jgi:four helix bundle protein
MNPEELKQRTKAFAIRVVRMVKVFPKGIASNVIAYQIVKSSTSTAANYRAACRAKSNTDFIAKIKIVEEEADETLFWLEIISEIELVKKVRIVELIKEANELTAIFSSSAITAKKALLKAAKSKIVKSSIENH